MLLAILGVVGIVVLTGGTAVFVAAEFALVAADRAELEQLASTGDRKARRALEALRRLSFQLSAAQLGITVTTLAVGFLSEPALTTLFEPALRATGLPHAAVQTLALVVAMVLATIAQMIGGELVPKNLAIARPTSVARWIAAPMRAFTAAFGPVIGACNAVANAVVRALGMQPQEELRSARSAAELDSLVRNSAEAGTLPASVATLLTRSLDFGEHTAGSVMTPRTRLTTIAADASVAEVLATAAATGHTRIPLVDARDPDTLTAAVPVVRAVAVEPARRAATRAVEHSVPLPSVPESLRLEPLLRELRRAPAQMVSVIDEWGGLAGIVTLEDVVEELAGDITDEHDADTPTSAAEGVHRLPGLLRLDEVAASVPGFAAPAGPYDTLAGFVLDQLGRLAEPGDVVQAGVFSVTVESLDGRRIDQVAVRRTP